MCQEDPWKSVIDQAKDEASKAGLSEDTIFGAEKAITDGSAEKVAEDALGGGSLDDWVPLKLFIVYVFVSFLLTLFVCPVAVCYTAF